MLSASHYLDLLNNEISNITGLCDKWQGVLSDTVQNSVIPDEVCGNIQIAVGQAQLLMKKKFEQFRGLIAFCENGGFEKQVTVEDLQGFWEVMYIQVEDIHKKFEEIETLKKNNWESPCPEEKNQRKPLGNLNKGSSHALLQRKSGVIKKDFSAQAKERLAQAKALARKRIEQQCCQ